MDSIGTILYRFYLELGTVGLSVLGILAFVAVGRSPAVLGDTMEKASRIGQLYGYTVCLVAVITFLLSAHSLVQNIFRYADPIASQDEPFRMGFEPSLTSFDAFRATYMFGSRGVVVALARSASADSTRSADTLGTTELRTRYEALRSERITQTRNTAAGELVTNALLLLFAVLLFVTHWLWLRRREHDNGIAAAPA